MSILYFGRETDDIVDLLYSSIYAYGYMAGLWCRLLKNAKNPLRFVVLEIGNK